MAERGDTGGRNDHSGPARDVFQARVINIHGPAPEPAANELPPRAEVFVNRVGERAALAALAEDPGQRRRPAVAIISAGPGTGKSALAVEEASHLRPRFPDGALYLDCLPYRRRGAVDSYDLLGAALRSFGVPDSAIQSDPDERLRQYRRKTADKRFLMIVENVELRPEFDDLLPSAPGAALMVTTRRPAAELKRLKDIPVTLGRLSAADSRELLAEYCGGDRLDAEPEATGVLIQYCQGRPWDLHQAGRMLDTDSRLPVRGLLDRLRAHLRSEGHMEAIAGLAYAELTDEGRRLYRLLTVLPGDTFDAGDAVAVTGWTDQDATRALGELHRAGLVEAAPGDRYVFQEVVRAHAEERAEDDEPREILDAAAGRVIDRYRDLARYADQREAGNRLRLDRRALPDEDNPFPDAGTAMAWLHANRETLLDVQHLAARYGRPDDVWRFTEAMWRSFMARRTDAAWRESCRLGLDAAIELGDPRIESRMRAQYGRWALSYGDPVEAEEYMRAAIDLAESAGDDALHASGLEFLGRLLYFQDRFGEAIEANERALSLDGDPRAQGLNHQFIGQCHRELGDLDEALEHLELAGQRFRESGHTHDLGKVHSDIGDVRHQLGRNGEACESYLRALRLLHSETTSYYEANTLRAYGNVLAEMGEYEEAAKALGSALAYFRETASPETEAVEAEYRAVA